MLVEETNRCQSLEAQSVWGVAIRSVWNRSSSERCAEGGGRCKD